MAPLPIPIELSHWRIEPADATRRSPCPAPGFSQSRPLSERVDPLPGRLAAPADAEHSPRPQMGTKWLLIALPLIVFGVLVQSVFWVPRYDSQARGNPQRLFTFLRAGIGDVNVLNPIISSNAWATEVMENNLFEGLIDSDENLKLVGRLADHWEITEEAYVAALPERTLPDGNSGTAVHIASLIEATWKGARLGGAETSIQGLELVAPETRTLSESVMVDDAKGKRTPVDVEMSIQVPARVKIRLSKVESRLWKQLESVLGASYFGDYPFAERFKLKKPELMAALREKLPELLGIGEHRLVQFEDLLGGR